MDFHQAINRRHTGAVKYDILDHLEEVDAGLRPYLKEDTLMMWVADMDFQAPHQVRQVLTDRLAHEIYGYTFTPPAYYEALEAWYRERYGYEISRDQVALIPGVVPGINHLIRCFTEPGDEIIIQSPVYHQFRVTIEKTGRRVLDVPLIEGADNFYTMDLEGLEERIGPRTKMMLLCSPHNPVGRVWTPEELRALGEILLKKDILLVADEIHGDLVRQGQTFTCFNQVDPRFKEWTILTSAPNKTFNIAGFKTANAIIQNPVLYQQFADFQEAYSLGGLGLLATLAQLTAYQEGGAWLDQLLPALDENIDYVVDYFAQHIPEISIRRPQGTYLLWLNCRGLGLAGQDLELFFVKEAGVYLNGGQAFSPAYADHMRMNIATNLDRVQEACSRIERAVVRWREAGH